MNTKLASVECYVNYSSGNYGVNALCFSIGSIDIYFSYKTVIAFRSPDTGLVIRENAWRATTGKHLNGINRDHTIRISGTEFEKQFEKMLRKHKISV